MSNEERLIWAYVKGFRRCVEKLKEKGIRIDELEAEADYLFPLFKQHPEKYDKL